MIDPSLDLDYVIEEISARRPFSFSRWGDGELQMAMGINKPTCDGHRYFQDMGMQLARILLTDSKYAMGLQPFATRNPKIIKWLKQAGIDKRKWFNADVFHQAAINNELYKLTEVLRNVNIVMIGPNHLEGMSKYFTIRHFIEVPKRDAFLKLDSIIHDTTAALSNLSFAVVSISAGPAAEIIIDHVFDCFGEHHSLIDFGSVWDPYCGVRSRSYMQ